MARCSHLCIGRQLVKLINLDEEMESDSETGYILVVDNPSSSKDTDNVKQHVNKGPIFSLKCLHEDDEQCLSPGSDNSNSDSRNITETTKLEKCSNKDSKQIESSGADSHVDINLVPELVMNCDDDSEDSESSKSNSDNELDVINMDEVPELIISSGGDYSKEHISPSTNTTLHTVDKSIDTADAPKLIGNSNKQSALRHSNPVKTTFSVFPQISSIRSSPSVPARNSFEGKYFFRIAVHHPQNLKKTDGLIYWESINKLYIPKDHPFKVLVSADSLTVPPESIIKVTAVYCKAEDSSKTVRRCPYHEQLDQKKGNLAYKHIVQSLSESAIYSESEDGILSVSVPYEVPQAGELHTSYIFEFTDYTSCHGGMNRRPIMLIFTLEKDGIVLGRQTLDARICAAPYRDYRNERNKLEKNNNYLMEDHSPKEITQQPKETFPNYYTITVKDPELYQFLQQMKFLYESSTMAKILSNKNA